HDRRHAGMRQPDLRPAEAGRRHRRQKRPHRHQKHELSAQYVPVRILPERHLPSLIGPGRPIGSPPFHIKKARAAFRPAKRRRGRFFVHSRISDKNSERAAALRRNCPRTADVTVLLPYFFTPRAHMHRCSPSTTTITPWGLSTSSSVSAICDVSRSCTCSRFVTASTRRASLLSPAIFPLGMYPMCALPKNGTRWCSHRL